MMDKDKIERIDWAQYSGPEDYDPDQVPQALNQLIRLNDEKIKVEIGNRVLFAIGNNHAGTYYPAVMDAIKIIIDTALNSEWEVARNCALDIMIDLYCSFCPELGAYSQCTSAELEAIVKAEVASIHKRLECVYLDQNESLRNMRLAGELIEAINAVGRGETSQG